MATCGRLIGKESRPRGCVEIRNLELQTMKSLLEPLQVWDCLVNILNVTFSTTYSFHYQRDRGSS
jgi:hypothetical protein